MRTDWLRSALSGCHGYQSELRPPVAEHTLLACEEQLGKRIPAAYRRFLAHHDGGAVFVRSGRDPADDGLHLFGAGPDEHGRTIASETDEQWSIYGNHLRGLTVFGHTPGAGAYYLAMTGRGQIVDLCGTPDRPPRKPSACPYYRGEWRVIASSLQELVGRMAQGQPDPFYWFRI